ncbi:hypothetical protein [Bradyrhizobium sp. Rc3b]|uniref:hypothetical protein n=1 Tax=Bradyrhizobium sp. Rc3b TaxID=1855322 RepID=UPI00116093F0|nr:hypothetical protein [Bradyrhizobium sp. Rc3b]
MIITGRSDAGSDEDGHRNRRYLRADLPQVELVIDLRARLCRCGCGAMTKIAEDVSKRLDVYPGPMARSFS